MKALPPAKREVARAPGYLRPDDFLAFFRFVREKAYEKGSFRDFLKSQQRADAPRFASARGFAYDLRPDAARSGLPHGQAQSFPRRRPL